jgi:hypothetical protein
MQLLILLFLSLYLLDNVIVDLLGGLTVQLIIHEH